MVSLDSIIKDLSGEGENVTFDISSKVPDTENKINLSHLLFSVPKTSNKHKIQEVFDIPEKYIPCLQESLKCLNSAMKSAGASKILYKLEQNNGKQKIMVLHNGDKILYRDLTDINTLLKRISSGETNINKWNNVNKGNFKWYNYLIAAQELNKCGGKMIMKKLNNGEYSMKTYIEIPAGDKFNN